MSQSPKEYEKVPLAEAGTLTAEQNHSGHSGAANFSLTSSLKNIGGVGTTQRVSR